MKKNIISCKTFEFAIRIVRLFKYLQQEQREFVLSKQLLRCGTSIGANVEEAQAAQSKKDFVNKMSIAAKEGRETKYWLKLLLATEYMSPDLEHVQTLMKEITEINKILAKIIKTTHERDFND